VSQQAARRYSDEKGLFLKYIYKKIILKYRRGFTIRL